MTMDDIIKQDTAERFRLGLPPITPEQQRGVVALMPLTNTRHGAAAPDLLWAFRKFREAQAGARQQGAVPALAGPSQRAAVPDSGPVTVNMARRTVEVVWATGARVRNFVPALGWIMEELDMSPNAVRLATLRAGRAPVLNAHNKGTVRDVLGCVVTARIEGGRGLATLRFTSAADVEPIWQRVVEGTLRGVSTGYRVHRYEQQRDGAEMVHRAMDWEPYEISLVPVPIDGEAMTR